MEKRGLAISRPAVWLLIAALAVVSLVAGSWSSSGSAQDAATPPSEASPTALSPEEARFARLGGSLADILATYGAPDWTDTGMVGYNVVSLGGVDTITMVFYDAQERVRSYLLVYLQRPDALDSTEAIANVVADVVPRDGVCGTEPEADSTYGDATFACSSEALEEVFTQDDFAALDVVGENGTYNFAVDPTDDAYFEIVVRLGTNGVPGPPTPVPTPSPVPPPPPDKTYPPIDDAAALIDGSIRAGTPLSVTGTVLEIRPATTGTTLIMEVTTEDESSVIVAAENQDDLAGIYAGETWTVFGVYTGYECADTGCVATIYIMKLG